MSETPAIGGPPSSGGPTEDPWTAFGYLAAGVIFYGFIGWLLSLWLHASFWIPVGILVGAGFGTYLVFNRYRFHGSAAAKPETADGTVDKSHPARPAPDREERL